MKIRKLSNQAAVSARFRMMLSAGACAGASALALAGGAMSAQAATRCTWGGMPDHPTGTVRFYDPGLTTTPSPTAIKFLATGVVAGGGPCHGQTVTFDGQADAGSSCAGGVSFEGRVEGLPGVAWLWGKAVGTVVRELDYDSNGKLVGSDQAIVNPPQNDPLFQACNSPQGFRTAPFSGEWDLSTP